MNQEKINDMYYHCETATGSYTDIEWLEKLADISNYIEELNSGTITQEEFVNEMIGFKCPFGRNGSTIEGACFKEPKSEKFGMTWAEAKILCGGCWKEFLEIK